MIPSFSLEWLCLWFTSTHCSELGLELGLGALLPPGPPASSSSPTPAPGLTSELVDLENRLVSDSGRLASLAAACVLAVTGGREPGLDDVRRNSLRGWGASLISYHGLPRRRCGLVTNGLGEG